jgi:hypothetical protein
VPRGTLGRPHARVKGACRTARGSLRHQRCASAGLPYAECVPARCLEFALTGSRHRLCPGRTLSVRASAAAARGPSRRTAWAIASRDEGGGVRPRALDELLVGVGQGVCIRTILPSCKEGIRHDTQGAYREYTGALAEGVAAMQVACMGRDRLKAVGPRARVEQFRVQSFFQPQRTSNM